MAKNGPKGAKKSAEMRHFKGKTEVWHYKYD
jgi:hypothetical protein